MLNKILKISLILTAITIMGCSKKVEIDVKTLGKEDTILAFGDSLTFGMGAKANESYPEQLSNITGYHVVNGGLNGDTANGALPRLKREIEESQPKLVILALGGNDMLKKQDEKLEENLTTLIKYIKEKDIQVVMLATPQPNVFSHMIGTLKDASLYSNVAQNTQTFLIEDVYSNYLSQKKYKSDLIHLNADGYNLVAQDIAKELKNNYFIEY